MNGVDKLYYNCNKKHTNHCPKSNNPYYAPQICQNDTVADWTNNYRDYLRIVEIEDRASANIWFLFDAAKKGQLPTLNISIGTPWEYVQAELGQPDRKRPLWNQEIYNHIDKTELGSVTFVTIEDQNIEPIIKSIASDLVGAPRESFWSNIFTVSTVEEMPFTLIRRNDNWSETMWEVDNYILTIHLSGLTTDNNLDLDIRQLVALEISVRDY